MTRRSSKLAKTRTLSPKQPSEFDKLWSVLPHMPGSVVRLFTRKGDQRDGDFAGSVREIKNFADAHSDRNVYVAPNPTCATGGARHSAKDVTHWSYFLIDVDPVEEEARPLNALDAILLRFGEWVGRDFRSGQSGMPVIIDSGRGVQAWIRLCDIPLDDGFQQGRIVGAADAGGGSTDVIHRATARRVNGYWLKKLDERFGVVHGCKIDTSVSDLPRVMRCPGTLNVKTGRMSRFIHVTDQRFSGLAQLMVTGTPEDALHDPVPTEGIEPGQPWQMVFQHLTRSAQSYLTQGQAEPGRHKVMWHTAQKLKELGVSRSEARKALKHANGLAGPSEELPGDQVKHALDTAYKK